ncbi:hypothetical protein [Pyrococcus kukulkanii]|uniref:Uncharacterized protein n=1 Tax=Pyrococcus kukulkanii TaxID=1609559 RepID=A0A127B8L7_9EURY|nr:hypothetical protein [Pyrococcus kukulkanii]AMM53527.1 hypothetical protein TQ32_02765 [Pyrococcus kukulkanii]
MRAKYSLEEGIKKIVRWYLKNEWWRPLVNEKNSLPMEAGVVIEKFKLRSYLFFFRKPRPLGRGCGN